MQTIYKLELISNTKEETITKIHYYTYWGNDCTDTFITDTNPWSRATIFAKNGKRVKKKFDKTILAFINTGKKEMLTL